MKKVFATLAFIISELSLAFPALAIFHTGEGTQNVLRFLIIELFKYPTDTVLDFNFFVFNFILPLIAVVAVIAAFMKELNIFRRAKNFRLLLSVVIALMALPTGGLALLVSATSQFLGFFAWIIFFLLFIFGTAAYALIRGRGWQSEFAVASAQIKAIEDVEKRIKEIQFEQRKVYERFGNGEVREEEYRRIIDQLDRERSSLTSRLRTLRERA